MLATVRALVAYRVIVVNAQLITSVDVHDCGERELVRWFATDHARPCEASPCGYRHELPGNRWGSCLRGGLQANHLDGVASAQPIPLGLRWTTFGVAP